MTTMTLTSAIGSTTTVAVVRETEKAIFIGLCKSNGVDWRLVSV